MSLQDGLGRVPLERRLAGQALEEDAAERVDVATGADGFPLDLLWGEVVDGAEVLRILRQRCSRGELLPQAEAEEEDVLA